MLNFERYIENQKKLSEKKSKKIDLQSLPSTSFQNIQSSNPVSNKIEKNIPVSRDVKSNSDSDSEYLPTDEDNLSDEEIISIKSTHSKKPKTCLKKIYDDGDKSVFIERIGAWKAALESIKSGNIYLDEEQVKTADVQYALLGHNDGNEFHEIDNNFSIPQYIWRQLYKYQRVGVKWLYELHQVESGGLLGDEMGLGKTVQVIAFLSGLAKSTIGAWNGLGPTIIVAPATLVFQWVSHFHYWCPFLRVSALHNSGSYNGKKSGLIKDIHGNHGILIVTYAGLVTYADDLLSRNWHYIILDEGHKIRNPDTKVSKLVKKFLTPHRILITGSPMQNNLLELWSLFDFMSPRLLGTQTAFQEFFANPITQGGYANASQLQEATAIEIAKSLKNIITPFLLRRTKAQVQEHINLPEKNEQVLFCGLTTEQRELYMSFLLSPLIRSILDKDNKYGDPIRAKILVAIMTLRKICNHPDLFIYDTNDDEEPVNAENFGYWKRSGKMTVVHSLLKIWNKQGHRALIFTQSRAMLCLLEQFLLENKYKYLKMDGSVAVGSRQNIIKSFNEDKKYLVFLATTRVGGLGVNLTGADRVIIYDPDWNPATDSQAKERAWRIGQTRNVTVYRLLSAGTIEEKIYQRQIFKHLLSNKVFIDPNQVNLLKTSTLQGLFTLEEPNREGDTETAAIFSHTKVGSSQKFIDDSNAKKNILEAKRKKLNIMRQKAKEISARIGKQLKQEHIDDDPRENYKTKRKKLLEPIVEEVPIVNKIDDEETGLSFEAALSEIEIVNKHIKTNYVENLIKDSLKSAVESENIEDDPISIEEDKESINQSPDTLGQTSLGTNEEANNESENHTVINESKVEVKKRTKKERELKKSDIENIVSVKKIKEKRKKQDEENEDDYVLGKLFKKTCVRSALEHDKIVGLAEQEQQLKVKEEASKRAKCALRALKRSRKNNRI